MLSADHLVICGLGRLGSATACTLRRQRKRADEIWIVENDPERSEAARKLGYRTVLGDASEQRRLRVAHIGAAVEVVVCVGDRSAAAVVKSVRQLAPASWIKAALHTCDQRETVLSVGASEVIVLAQLAGRMLADSIDG